MTITPEILSELRRFNKNIEWLKAQANKNQPAKWVKASTIYRITGWSRNRLQRARDNKEIEFTRTNGFWYNPASINPIHLKQTS